ncbi:MAG: hypothetical protein ABFS39_04610 [Pseudomonadota bacterium]
MNISMNGIAEDMAQMRESMQRMDANIQEMGNAVKQGNYGDSLLKMLNYCLIPSFFELRWACPIYLVNCHRNTHFAVQWDASTKRFYERKQRKTNRIIAIRAVARKLARASWMMLKHQTPYDEQMLFG